MRKAKLIGEEATWQQLNYSRCGRTDKGVSAAGQVLFPHPHPSWLLNTSSHLTQQRCAYALLHKATSCLALEVERKCTSVSWAAICGGCATQRT